MQLTIRYLTVYWYGAPIVTTNILCRLWRVVMIIQCILWDNIHQYKYLCTIAHFFCCGMYCSAGPWFISWSISLDWKKGKVCQNTMTWIQSSKQFTIIIHQHFLFLHTYSVMWCLTSAIGSLGKGRRSYAINQVNGTGSSQWSASYKIRWIALIMKHTFSSIRYDYEWHWLELILKQIKLKNEHKFILV